MAYAGGLLAEAGLDPDRLAMYHIGASDAPLWAETVREMTERVRSLGPNPLGTGGRGRGWEEGMSVGSPVS